MAGSSLLIETIQDATVINFQSRSILDSGSIEVIARELYHVVDGRAARKIVLDFSEVQFLSSQALGMLLTLKRKADAIRGQVVIAGLRKELRRLFKIMKLEKLFKFYDDEQKALAGFEVYAT